MYCLTPDVLQRDLERWVWNTRDDQKVLQFSMMYKWHRQNSHIIFQCNFPLYQNSSYICQKVPLFQPDRIPGACCRDTTPWPTWAHHHRKTLFREGDASDVEIGLSCYVSGLVSKVGETAAQIRCHWLWPVQLETCALEHYRAATAECQHSPPLHLHCLTQICQHFTVVGSSHCCLLWYVMYQHHAFAMPDNCGHNFPADGWVRNFLSGGELTYFHCIDSCFVSGSQWRIHVSSPVIIRDNTLAGVAL